MEIVFKREDVNRILGDYVVSSFGNVMGVKYARELDFGVEANYGTLTKITVSVKTTAAQDEDKAE